MRQTEPNRYTAAFFDRDGTLVYRDPAARQARAAQIERWTGKPLVTPPDLFERVLAGRRVETLADEQAFWRLYFAELLRAQGLAGDVSDRAEALFAAFWLKGLAVYPEVVPVLDAFRARGYRMGVISDTFPSLRLTIEAAGLSEYFDCYICSAEVGVMKPDPRIYRAALGALGVSAAESLYVDDYDVEADGARDLGFTAFHICRSEPPNRPWDIASLTGMIDYLDAARA